MLKISPVITEISQQHSPYFSIAKAYPFFPKSAKQFVPGPSQGPQGGSLPAVVALLIKCQKSQFARSESQQSRHCLSRGRVSRPKAACLAPGRPEDIIPKGLPIILFSYPQNFPFKALDYSQYFISYSLHVSDYSQSFFKLTTQSTLLCYTYT